MFDAFAPALLERNDDVVVFVWELDLVSNSMVVELLRLFLDQSPNHAGVRLLS